MAEANWRRIEKIDWAEDDLAERQADDGGIGRALEEVIQQQMAEALLVPGRFLGLDPGRRDRTGICTGTVSAGGTFTIETLEALEAKIRPLPRFPDYVPPQRDRVSDRAMIMASYMPMRVVQPKALSLSTWVDDAPAPFAELRERTEALVKRELARLIDDMLRGAPAGRRPPLGRCGGKARRRRWFKRGGWKEGIIPSLHLT